MTVKRNGGITFWRVGRLGGSYYLARRRAVRPVVGGTAIAIRKSRVEITAMVLVIAAILAFGG